jgi:hypothetical protein
MTKEALAELRRAAIAVARDGRTDDEWFYYLQCVHHKNILALLDALEAKDKSIAELERDLKTAEMNDTDARCHVAELQSRAESAEQRVAELVKDNEYIRNRFKELDLMFGKNLLVMQAAIIEWQGTGNAKSGLAWIYNTLFGPGELPNEEEKDAQAYFDRKYAPIDEELMTLHRWFFEKSEAERAASGITLQIKGGE